jgi:hypothetical protein
MQTTFVPDGAELFMPQVENEIAQSELPHRTELAKGGPARDAQKKSQN